MSEAVLKIVRDKELARSLAENAYKKVKEQYNVELMVRNTLDVYKDALKNAKILIIKFSALEDVIISTAAIRAVSERFAQGYKISFLVGEESRDALLRCPYIDELLVADFKGKDKGLSGLLNMGRVLRKKNFDIVIDLQNNCKSQILSWLSFSLKRYGYNNKKLSFLLNHRIKNGGPPVDPLTHQFRILKMLGIDLKDSHLELWPSEEDENYADELLNSQWLTQSQRLIGINLNASPRWATKSWSLTHIARLCEELEFNDMRVVLTGTQNDSETAEALLKLIKNSKVINACGKTTINQLAALIKRCAVYISADSSFLHIAAAMATPFIALFGPTDPNRHTPPAKDFAIIKKEIPCRPCYKPKCKNKKCMDSITAEEVLGAIERFLK
jgi:heptosyltransferase-2